MLRVIYRSIEKDISKRFYDGDQKPGPQHSTLLENLRSFKIMTKHHQAKLTVIIYPRRQEIIKNKRLKDAAFLKSHLADEIQIIDLYPLFKKCYDQGSLDFLS